MTVLAVEAAASAEQFNFWYGRFQALRDITFSVAQGEVLALIGPSGCGKSTLLRCLNRMNDGPGNVARGRLVVGGREVYSATTDVVELRRETGMVFQRPNPLPMSVRDNVLFGLRLHLPSTPRAMAKERLEHALEAVGLTTELRGRLDDDAESLSLEQRQRLCIARLLPLEPRLLLMDEPCSALDPESTRRVEGLIHRLAGAHTIVIVTHSMQQARRVAARTGYLDLGELVEVGPTEAIFERPQHARTAAYVQGKYG